MGKLARVSPYIPTFTILLNPSKYADLLVPQINGEFWRHNEVFDFLYYTLLDLIFRASKYANFLY